MRQGAVPRMSMLACADVGSQHPSAHDQYNCGQKLTGTVSIPFVELQLADGEFVVFEEIGYVQYPTHDMTSYACTLKLNQALLILLRSL